MQKTRVKALSAGHGGKNMGAASSVAPVWEKEITLRHAESALARDPSFLMLRVGDAFISHSERNAVANASGAELVIELHCDSTPWAPSQHGLHAYYRDGDTVARALCKYAVGAAPGMLRGGSAICAYDNPKKTSDDWKKRAQSVVESYDAHCVLLELGYLSNINDMKYLQSDTGLAACSRLILEIAARYDLIMEKIR